MIDTDQFRSILKQVSLFTSVSLVLFICSEW